MSNTNKKSRARTPAGSATPPESTPAGAAPLRLKANGGRLLEYVVRLGRRNWRVFYVTAEEVWQGLSELTEPGWYFEAVNPSPEWISNEPGGPYETLEALQEDAFEALRETP